MRNKLVFLSRRNAMRFVVVQQICNCLFSERQLDLISFLDDCLTACKTLLNSSSWTIDEVVSIAQEVWREFEVY